MTSFQGITQYRGVQPSRLPADKSPATAHSQHSPATRPFQVVAHRGARILDDWDAMAPANTMPAFEAAAQRTSAIELDVIATTDGQLVVHHDDETGHLFKMPGGDKLVRQATFAETQTTKLDPKAQEEDVNKMLGLTGAGSSSARYQMPTRYLNVKMPRLEAVVLGLPETHFYVELKTHDDVVRRNETNGLEERVAAFIRQHNLYERVTVISFSEASLRRVKQLDPRINTGLDFEFSDTAKPLPKPLKSLRDVLKVLYARYVLGVQSLHCRYQDTSPRMVKAAHRRGITVIPWVAGQTVDEEVAYVPTLRTMGADGMITNAVDRIQAALQENN